MPNVPVLSNLTGNSVDILNAIRNSAFVKRENTENGTWEFIAETTVSE